MIAKLSRSLKHFIVLLFVCLVTSGCVNYDLGVKFDSPNRGTIVQKIQLDDRLTSGTSQTWLINIEQRTKKLQGKVRKASSNEMIATIPFSNGQDLEQKFNEFFSAELAAKVRGKKSLELPKIDSKFVVQQGNFILLERTRLIYDVDLRSLGIADSPINPNSILDLQFSIDAPWGAQSLNRTKNGTVIPARRNGKQLVWTLQPGQENHIETAFWMPNFLGIGTLMIIAIVAGGIFFKKQQPAPVS